MFRSAVTKAQWGGAVKEGRAPFEPLGERTLITAKYTTELPNVPPGQYVVIQYRTKAGHGKTVVETITPAPDKDGLAGRGVLHPSGVSGRRLEPTRAAGSKCPAAHPAAAM